MATKNDMLGVLVNIQQMTKTKQEKYEEQLMAANNDYPVVRRNLEQQTEITGQKGIRIMQDWPHKPQLY